MILALDLGTKTGYAIGDKKGPISSGMMNFATKRNEGGGMRYVRFSRWLKHIIAQQRITEIYYEEVRRHAGTNAAHVYGGFMSHLTAICDEVDNELPYQSIPVGSIKKHATGRGNASKPEMIRAAITKGWMPKGSEEDNEADALHILDYAINILGAE